MDDKPKKTVLDDGTIVWRINGYMVHREDGPAFENTNGYRSWFLYDKRHRKDGPAVIHCDGRKEWWIHDEQIDCHTQEEFERYMRLKAFW